MIPQVGVGVSETLLTHQGIASHELSDALSAITSLSLDRVGTVDVIFSSSSIQVHAWGRQESNSLRLGILLCDARNEPQPLNSPKK